MYFQVIDNKIECIGHYHKNKLNFQDITDECKRTWKYSPSLLDRGVEFAEVLVGGSPYRDVCPVMLKSRLSKAEQKMSAFAKSIRTSDIDTRDHCIFDLVPSKAICELLECKNQITKYVFENYKKPQNYDFIVDIIKFVGSIGCGEVNIDFAELKRDYHIEKARRFLKKVKDKQQCVEYNAFGAKTGRLTTKRNSFPILNLDKEMRKYIKPNNDLFVEFDFNAAELRTLLALSGRAQPRGDIHEWNTRNLLEHGGSRDEVKKRTFAWLYNPRARDLALEGLYNREWVKNNYWDGTTVRTPFLRHIEADDHHALNYIVQSTSSDVCLEQAIKINKMLDNYKSNIVFLMHDSIVMDFCSEERGIVTELLQEFGKTRFGDYVVNLSIGTDFGNMRKING